MTFKSPVMPGVRAFASSMRVKLSREPTRVRPSALFAIPSCNTQASPRATIGWRICPDTGRLQQRWRFDDSQDPQSRMPLPQPRRTCERLTCHVEFHAA